MIALTDAAGLVFPLNKYTSPRWSSQHPEVRRRLFIASVVEVQIGADGRSTRVQLQTWAKDVEWFRRGAHYRLSPRLVDVRR